MSLWVLVKMLNATSVEWAWTTDDTMNLPGKKEPKRFIYWLLYSHYLAFKCHEMWITCSYFYIFFRMVIFFFSHSAISSFTASKADFLMCLCGGWLDQCNVLYWVSWYQLALFFILPVICDLHSVFWGECVRKLCTSQITKPDPQRLH